MLGSLSKQPGGGVVRGRNFALTCHPVPARVEVSAVEAFDFGPLRGRRRLPSLGADAFGCGIGASQRSSEAAHYTLRETIHINFMRKADSDETDLFYQNAGYF